MKRVFTFIALLSFFVVTPIMAQMFPFLNASTGNINEFPVDKDTNAYMFHGNRLVKMDKNFNTIWANTYTGLYFENLLLSKTGSVFFIGRVGTGYCFGKISSIGNLIWTNRTSSVQAVVSGTSNVNYFFELNSILLDRNNNLVLTGDEPGAQNKCFLIKSDTNGNVLKFKAFGIGGSGSYCFDHFSIISDSAGYFSIAGSGYQAMGPQSRIAIHTYNDNTDQFIQHKDIYYLGIPAYFEWELMKSKTGKNFYIYNTTQDAGGKIYSGLVKFNRKGTMLWSRNFNTFNGIPHAFTNHCEEDNNGNLFYSLSTSDYLAFHTSGYIKLDSSGTSISGNNITTMLNSYFTYNSLTTLFEIPSSKARVISSGKYYFDVFGYNFPSNPLTVQQFNSTLNYSCSVTSSCNVTSTVGVGLGPIGSPSIIPITSYSLPSYSNVFSAVSFSINPNYCIVKDVNQFPDAEMDLVVFPNPVNQVLYIEHSKPVNKIEIVDLSGRILNVIAGNNSIDVSGLSSGIYFINVSSDNSLYRRKFVKE